MEFNPLLSPVTGSRWYQIDAPGYRVEIITVANLESLSRPVIVVYRHVIVSNVLALPLADFVAQFAPV